MLKELHIQNYAIIESLVIPFDGRLNIITGETGAGKSILMGALSLILGERADSSMVLNREKKCYVEGHFKMGDNEAVKTFLEAYELDILPELLIRREIGVNGKSRAFVNDSPVTLQQLQELTTKLVDLHRQFDTLSLGDAGFQLAVIDAMANNEKKLQAYKKYFFQWQQIQKLLAELLTKKAELNREFDYNQFLFTELEESDFKENELEALESELALLNSSEGIKTSLVNVSEQLSGEGNAVIVTIRQLQQQLVPFQSQHILVNEMVERLKSVQVELSDIASEADRFSGKISNDPGRVEAINERINTGYKLLKKHGVKTTADLLSIMNVLSGKLEASEQLDDKINESQKALEETAAAMKLQSDLLSAERKKQLKPFEQQVNQLLHRIGMPNATLKVQLDVVAVNASGTDAIDFLFDANKSKQFASLKKVASGGELSRLMLSIKSLVAGKMDLPTLIFDEIDSGISGEASRQVGLVMKELSVSRQIICITHQPQIAGKADHHLFVYKEEQGKKINTNIRVLPAEERIVRIAMMLSGERPSDAAMENAREMMTNGRG